MAYYFVRFLLNLSCDLLKEEIRMAISLLKTGKTPGPDEIPAEAIKADKETFIEILYDLIGNIMGNRRNTI